MLWWARRENGGEGSAGMRGKKCRREARAGDVGRENAPCGNVGGFWRGKRVRNTSGRGSEGGTVYVGDASARYVDYAGGLREDESTCGVDRSALSEVRRLPCACGCARRCQCVTSAWLMEGWREPEGGVTDGTCTAEAHGDWGVSRRR